MKARLRCVFLLVLLVSFVSQEMSLGQTSSWISSSPGNLLVNGNWDTASAPNSVGAVARITANAPTNAGSFLLNGTMTLGELRYANNNNGIRSIDGTGNLVLHASGTNKALVWITSASGGLELRQRFLTLNSDSEFRIARNSTWNTQITGTRGFELTGGQRLILQNSANNYQGSTTISEGILMNGASNVLPDQTNLVIKEKGVWRLQDYRETIASMQVDSGGTFEMGKNASLTVTGVANLGIHSIIGPDLGALTFGSLQMNGGEIKTWGSLTVGSSNQDSYVRLSGSSNFVFGPFRKTGTGTFVQENGFLSAGDSGFVIDGGVFELRGNAVWNGLITNNGVVRYNISSANYDVNAITGTGDVEITGTAVCNFIDESTFTGTLTISNGVSQIGNGGAGGSIGTGDIINHATLRFNRSNALNLSNRISGTGSVQQVGSGTSILTGANSYTGTTIIVSGALQIGNGGNSGTLGTGAVTNNSNLLFNRSNDYVVSNAIGGVGVVQQIGTGTTTLASNNTYTGTTIIRSGTLRIGNGGNTGSLGSGAVTNDGHLIFNRSNNMGVANSISGTGAITKLLGGVTVLTGENTYTGSTSILAGILRVGAGGESGTIGAGTVFNQSLLQIYRSNSLLVANTITGIGNLENIGTGTTILTGQNSYSGLTLISSGSVSVGNGGTTGRLGTGSVINNSSLVFNRSDSVVVANDISGSGRVTKQGTGTLRLTGVGTYSGTTSVNEGNLLINGSHSGGQEFFTHAGATIGGKGSIGSNLVIDNLAFLAPGDSNSGIFTISGDLSLNGTYLWELTDSSTADIVVLMGDLDLGGTSALQVFSSLTQHGSDKYTMFAYDGILTGEFGQLPAGWMVNYRDSTQGRNAFNHSGRFNYVTITAVPEPSSGLLLVGFLTALAFVRYRKD